MALTFTRRTAAFWALFVICSVAASPDQCKNRSDNDLIPALAKAGVRKQAIPRLLLSKGGSKTSLCEVLELAQKASQELVVARKSLGDFAAWLAETVEQNPRYGASAEDTSLTLEQIQAAISEEGFALARAEALKETGKLQNCESVDRFQGKWRVFLDKNEKQQIAKTELQPWTATVNVKPARGSTVVSGWAVEGAALAISAKAQHATTIAGVNGVFTVHLTGEHDRVDVAVKVVRLPETDVNDWTVNLTSAGGGVAHGVAFAPPGCGVAVTTAGETSPSGFGYIITDSCKCHALCDAAHGWHCWNQRCRELKQLSFEDYIARLRQTPAVIASLSHKLQILRTFAAQELERLKTDAHAPPPKRKGFLSRIKSLVASCLSSDSSSDSSNVEL